MMTEMDKLEQGLQEKGINYLRHTRGWDFTDQILVYNDENEVAWDAICGAYSYGGPEGLLEVMGLTISPDNEDDVEGYLTAEDILGVL